MTNEDQSEHLFAVDVGNSRIKWGLFRGNKLADVVSLPAGDCSEYDRQLSKWREQSREAIWAIASVNINSSEGLIAWLRERRVDSIVVIDDPNSLPLRVALDRPRAIGIDRLLDAVAANARRPADRSAIIVDAGSAITVDAVNCAGEFVGGAIAAGIGVASRALHEFTYWLPRVLVDSAPPPIGRATDEAIRSGLYWGAVGAIKELIDRLTASLRGDPVVFLTGGDAPLLAPHFDPTIELVPNLTLTGIQLAYRHVRTTQKSATV